ncbi:MAG: hypothetical protein ACJA2N_001102 [Salibacteraceae bacterium]
MVKPPLNAITSDQEAAASEYVSKTPTHMIIQTITLVSWPQTNNGIAWDKSGYPDLYPVIESGTANLFTGSVYFEECNPENIYAFNASSGLPLVIGSLSDTYSIGIYDFDSTTANDEMGGMEFTPNEQHVFGETTVNLSSGENTFELGVNWIY